VSCDVPSDRKPYKERPPNHKLVDVSFNDACDASPRVVLLSLTSNEPDDGLGDGDTANDIQGAVLNTDDRAFQLRAERSSQGSGRVYTATYRIRDASGNTAQRLGDRSRPAHQFTETVEALHHRCAARFGSEKRIQAPHS
jgi:hypothetical protein